MKKIVRPGALMLALLLILTACNSAPKYRTDVSASELSEALRAKIEGGDKLTAATESFIQGSMDIDVSEYADYSILITVVGTSINEIGILKAKDEEQVKEIQSALESYLQLRNEAWMPEYLPGEYPKLKNAEIKTAGLYVMYAILSESERAAVFEEFEAELKS